MALFKLVSLHSKETLPLRVKGKDKGRSEKEETTLHTKDVSHLRIALVQLTD